MDDRDATTGAATSGAATSGDATTGAATSGAATTSAGAAASAEAVERAAWLTSPRLRLGIFALLVAFAIGVSVTSDGISLAAVRDGVADLGALGPLVWVLVYLGATVLLLPGTPFTVGAGLLFGPVLGAVTALVGATLGATASFLVGRLVGRDAVAGLAGSRLRSIDDFLATRGFPAVLIVRLLPIFPFNLVNLVAGVTAVRLVPYVLATAIGIIPGTVLLAVSGGAVDDPTSPLFLGSVAGFAALVVVGGFAARRLRPAEPEGATPGDEDHAPRPGAR